MKTISKRSHRGNNLEPKSLKMSPFQRVMFGYDAEVVPERMEDTYLEGLIEQERLTEGRLVSAIKWLLLLNVLSLLLVSGIPVDYKLFGTFEISKIPSLEAILCLLLGVVFANFIMAVLDVALLASIRVNIVEKRRATDLPNIDTAHLKGGGLWLDILGPKFIGYSTGKLEASISLCAMVALSTYLFAFIILSSCTLYSLYNLAISNIDFLSWPAAFATSGIVVAATSLLVLLGTFLLRFTYRLHESN